ncbi:MAG: 6-bladed beta-propeller [Candidatus Aminicenantes bacterium]|nr:6-bladed beta-propeller [Candidatus Aminicenantes bacterium]
MGTMMNKMKIVSILLLIFVVSCSKNHQKWQGTIEEKNGVTIVKNPQEGIWDTKENKDITMVKKIQIGKEDGPEEYLFGYISDAAVNSKGDIYIADRQLNEIRKFNKKGEHLLTIGRLGQGPGEFQNIHIISVSPQDHLLAFDNMLERISVFKDNGEHLKTTKKLLKDTWVTPSKIFHSKGNYIIFGHLGNSLKIFHEFDREWNILESYIDYEFIDNKEFEERQLGFNPGNAFFKQDGDFLYTKYFYDNQIFIYSGKTCEKILRRKSDIKKPYDVRVFHDMEKAKNVPDSEYDFGSYGKGIIFLGVSYQCSLGLYQLSNGYIVNFIRIRKSKDLFEFGVEMYGPEGKLLKYSKLGENIYYDMCCMDSHEHFYAIERKDYNKIFIFRLEY